MTVQHLCPSQTVAILKNNDVLVCCHRPWLKVDDYGRDIFIAVLDLNSKVCRNTMPKVDYGPIRNYSKNSSDLRMATITNCKLWFAVLVEKQLLFSLWSFFTPKLAGKAHQLGCPKIILTTCVHVCMCTLHCLSTHYIGGIWIGDSLATGIQAPGGPRKLINIALRTNCAKYQMLHVFVSKLGWSVPIE